MTRRHAWTGVMAALALSVWASSAGAGLVFSDDFEGVGAGGGPDSGKWWVNTGWGPVTVVNDTAAQGTNSLKIQGTNNVLNAQVRSRLAGDNYTTFFVTVSLRVDNDATATNGACLDLLTNNGGLVASLRFFPQGAGTGKYDVKVMTGGSASSQVIHYDTVATGLPINTWTQWTFGVQITDNATGAGTYSVYQDSLQLAKARSYTYPFTPGTTCVNQLQFFGDVGSLRADSVQAFDSVVASTGLVFRDDFEGLAAGGAPDTSKWYVVPGWGPVTVVNDTAAQGTNSLKIQGTNNVLNAEARSKIAGDNYTTFFVTASMRVDNDATAANGACLDLVNTNGGIAASLRFIPKGAGTGKYDVKVLTGASASSSSSHLDTVATGLPINTWAQWTFGIQITDPTTGAGKFWVYENDFVLASAKSYTYSFTPGTTYVNQLQFFGDVGYFRADNVQAYNAVLAGTGLVFLDDFESVAAGSAPDTSKWSVVAGWGPVTVDNAAAAQGSNSLKIQGTNNVKNASVRSKIAGDNYTTFFASAWMRVDNDATAANGACLDLVNNNGNIAASLRFIPKGAGTGQYDVKVVTGGSASSQVPYSVTVATGRAINTWTQWAFGIQIADNATGAGTYTVYENGNPLATAVSYSLPLTPGTVYVNQLQFFGDVGYFRADYARAYIVPVGATPPPVVGFTPTAGTYGGPQTVTITCDTSGATIRYTTDGTDPAPDNTTGTIYTGPITVAQSLTLKARAWAAASNPGAVLSAFYAIVLKQGNIPHGALALDGHVSDWPAASQWSPPFVTWFGAGLTSTTQAQFAWNAAQNVVYVAVQTNEASVQGGGHLVLGLTDNLSSVPVQSLDSTQLCFDYDATQPGNVLIRNEVQLLGGSYTGVTTGVRAACDNASGVYTYEIALPLWGNWTTGTDARPLTVGKTVYLYAVMQSYYNSMAPGTDLSYYGNPEFYNGGSANPSTWTKAATLTLLAPTAADLATVLAAMDTVQGQPGFDARADIDGDGEVTSTDLAIVLANMQ